MVVRKDTIICPYCGEDTDIPKVLFMVIPDEGLSCPHCYRVVVQGSNVSYKKYIWKGKKPPTDVLKYR